MHFWCCPDFIEKIISCDNLLNSDVSVMVEHFRRIYFLMLKLFQVIFKGHQDLKCLDFPILFTTLNILSIFIYHSLLIVMHKCTQLFKLKIK